ncbi:MAG TPA: DNA-3-methyladenine glycosylase I [Burkholderiales bacterium]|nr:DNA-3-methyladenine glycosylase I [Burkholderiales bacterium]
MEPKRCRWAKNPLAIRYHDREWGVPVRSDRKFFEFLVLEGAQAGLSWDTILAKRGNYRKAFDGFDPGKIAKYTARRKKALLQNAGIVRNRLKIESTVTNAEAFLRVQEEFGSFSAYVWAFVDGRPIRLKRGAAVPARTKVSDALSKDLKRRGFKFVGKTIMYAFMQATGMVNDHAADCFRYKKACR